MYVKWVKSILKLKSVSYDLKLVIDSRSINLCS